MKNLIIQELNIDGSKRFPRTVSDAIILHGVNSDFPSNGITLTQFLNKKFNPSKEFKFLHYSDTHEGMVTVNKVNQLMAGNDTYDMAIHTGDICLDEVQWQQAVDANPKLVAIPGNHDIERHTQQEMHDGILKSMGTRTVRGNEATGNYWHKDYICGAYTVRFIAFDEYEDTLAGGKSGYNVVRTRAQMDWFINLLRNTPSNYYLILAHHQPCAESRDVANKGKFISELAVDHYHYQSRGNAYGFPADLIPMIIDCYLHRKKFNGSFYMGDNNHTLETFDVDFSNLNPCHFLFHIAGHTHWDVCEYLENFPEQLILVVDQARANKSVYSDLKRDTEDSAYCINEITLDFDLQNTTIKRIGAHITDSGANRETITFPFKRF